MATKETAEEKIVSLQSKAFALRRRTISFFYPKCIGRSNRTLPIKISSASQSITFSWKSPLNRWGEALIPVSALGVRPLTKGGNGGGDFAGNVADFDFGKNRCPSKDAKKLKALSVSNCKFCHFYCCTGGWSTNTWIKTRGQQIAQRRPKHALKTVKTGTTRRASLSMHEFRISFTFIPKDLIDAEYTHTKIALTQKGWRKLKSDWYSGTRRRTSLSGPSRAATDYWGALSHVRMYQTPLGGAYGQG